MPARAELTLAALGLIHHCSADSLRGLARARKVFPDESWNVYALAKALIDPEAVWHQLSGLDRDSLAHIDQLRQRTGPLELSLPWGITDTEVGCLRPEVIHAIDTFSSEWKRALATVPSTPHAIAARDVSHEVNALQQSLPRVIDALDALGLAITLVSHNDITLRTSATLSLAKALGQIAPDVSADWTEAADWGVWSGLLLHQGGSWWVSSSAEDFVASDRADQLATLATLWWESCEDTLRLEFDRIVAADGSPASLVDHALTRFPLYDSSTLADFFERGHKVGALSANQATALVSHLVSGDDLKKVLEPLMPPPAPGVYLDSVDSVVGAGPLTVEQQKTLSRVARCVRGGMTPRWVIDRDRVLDSLGHTSARELCRELETVIIGGLPDSLRQQIVDWESRAQSLAVSADFPGASIHCADHYLSELLLVDQKLQSLQLTRTNDTTLSSKRDAPQTRQLLLDAGYPTFPHEATIPSPRVLSTPPPVSLPDSWWSEIVASAKDMPHNAVWTEDVLHDAISERTLLALSVRVGDTERQMVVEPRSIAGGRLRVKDTSADVERTLPLDTIVSIHPAQPSVT